MSASDCRTKLIQEFAKLGLSTQVSMLEAMADALDNMPKNLPGGIVRELFKSNAAFLSMGFRAAEQSGAEFLRFQSDALKQSSAIMKTMLSQMDDVENKDK